MPSSKRRCYQDRKAAGVCVLHPEVKAEAGRVYCEPCLAKHRASALNRLNSRRAAGVCTSCGDPDLKPKKGQK